MITRRIDEESRLVLVLKGYHIPFYMYDGLIFWILYGELPGDFLTAVLKNDLKEAIARADDINRDRLRNYVQFLYNEAPNQCWGSPEKVKAWRKSFLEKKESE